MTPPPGDEGEGDERRRNRLAQAEAALVTAREENADNVKNGYASIADLVSRLKATEAEREDAERAAGEQFVYADGYHRERDTARQQLQEKEAEVERLHGRHARQALTIEQHQAALREARGLLVKLDSTLSYIRHRGCVKWSTDRPEFSLQPQEVDALIGDTRVFIASLDLRDRTMVGGEQRERHVFVGCDGYADCKTPDGCHSGGPFAACGKPATDPVHLSAEPPAPVADETAPHISPEPGGKYVCGCITCDPPAAPDPVKPKEGA